MLQAGLGPLPDSDVEILNPRAQNVTVLRDKVLTEAVKVK